MKRVSSLVRVAVVLIALAGPSASWAEDAASGRVIKRSSGKPQARGETPAPDPSRTRSVPMPVVQTRVAAESCSPEQEAKIEAARRAAAIRSQVATDRARGLHPSTGEQDRRDAQRHASKLIDDDVDFDQVVEITESIRDRVSSASLRTVCEGKSNPNCAVRSAYVENLSPPIHVCPAFFETSSDEQNIRTLIHESAHLSRIREEGESESYCVLFDCDTNCGGFYAADSWAHFVHCVAGETPDAYDE